MTTRKNRSRSTRLTLESLEQRLCLTAYSLLELPPASGHATSMAYGLSDGSAGEILVVGRSSPETGLGQPVAWEVDKTDGSVTPVLLPLADDFLGGRANDVNNAELITGSASYDTGYDDNSGNPITEGRAAVWLLPNGPDGAYNFQSLHTSLSGAVPGLLGSQAEAITHADNNGNFWVVGTAAATDTGCINQQNQAGKKTHAIVWIVDGQGNSSAIDLEPSVCDARAYDVEVIGDSIFVAGRFTTYDQNGSASGVQAAKWQLDENGTVLGRSSLGDLGGAFSVAYGINHLEQTAGQAELSDGTRNAFLHDASMSDLGSLGDRGSQAAALNSKGAVVGNYSSFDRKLEPETAKSAFLWRDGVMLDLNDLVVGSTSWRLDYATDVNESNEVVGIGLLGKGPSATTQAYLALPQAGVTVAPNSGLETDETGSTDSFSVVLDTPPSSDVVIAVASSDPGEGTADINTLTFTSDNWNTPQIVTVTGVDDSDTDGDIAYTIVLSAASSGDSNYDGIDPVDVSLINVDDDSSGGGNGGKGGGGKGKKLLATATGEASQIRLTQEVAEAVVSEAIALWSRADGGAIEHGVEVVVADLPAGQLGEAYGNRVILDIDGNGAGWSVNGAGSQYDLLTVAAHEIGHILGHDHSHDETDLMASHLPVGTRRLPSLLSQYGSDALITDTAILSGPIDAGLSRSSLLAGSKSELDQLEDDLVSGHRESAEPNLLRTVPPRSTAQVDVVLDEDDEERDSVELVDESLLTLLADDLASL